MRWFFKYYLFILTGIILALAAAILAFNPGYLSLLPQSASAVYVENALQGRYASGNYAGQTNRLDFTLAEPGDILLGGKPGGAYGHFTHAGLYLGHGWVLEGYVDCGISRQRVEHYRDYDWACILRVNLPQPRREKAVEYARLQEYKPFYPVAFKTGERYWNCTKLIWAAYLRGGVDLDSRHDLWVTPDAIYFSPYVRVVASEGKMP